jgi:CelD/BcsL family acetyltransferase involved in cellulose biosynthesis
LRSDLRRRRRLLEKQGRTTIETSNGRTGLDELLREGFAVESASWKGDAGTAIAARPETSRFYREVATWATERGMLRLTCVRLDDRPIAFGYYLSDGGVRYSLKTAFDPRFREVAPGKLLARAALKDAFDDGCTRFDFLGDDEPYKVEWATGLRDLVLVQLFAPTTPGRVAWAALGPGRAVTVRARQLARVGSR